MQKFVYSCVDCGNEVSDENIQYLCPCCNKNNEKHLPPKGVLKVLYDYETVKKSTVSDDFIELLPYQFANSKPQLLVGNTPLYKIDAFDLPDSCRLYVKDDSQNPTYSFKDRASAIVSAYAKEKGVVNIAAASTGNAGSSIAGICASQKQNAIVFVPAKAPVAKLTQILMYGATLIPVDGTYDDAFDLSIEASKEFNWYNRNTAYNPLTIEGKKTISFEIYQNFNGDIPDNIFVPVGDGAIISGVYKGFEDLLKLGLINKMPTIYSVQSIGSNNINANIEAADFTGKASNTVADSISVDIPRNFNMTQNFIKTYNGKYIDVSDKEILDASVLLANKTGLFAEPAAACAMAGFLKAIKNDFISEIKSKNLVLLTGSGLKDITAVSQLIKKPAPINCDLKSVKKLLHL